MDGLLQILSGIALPFTYDHSAEGEPPNLPFVYHLFPGSDNFPVDGRVYYKINEVSIEFYCDSKNPALEATLEVVLDEHGIFYNKTEVWVKNEKLCEVLYTLEMEVQSTWTIKSSIA